MRVLAFINRKGGVGKTTTALGVAYGAQDRGESVAVIDADPNASASQWLDESGGVEVIARPADEIAETLDLFSGLPDPPGLVIIDSAPNDADAIAHLAKVSDLVVVPLAPSGIEVAQLLDTVEVIESAGARWVVVPTRVRMSTSAGKQIRELCETQQIPVTRAVVPLAEAVARSFGGKPPRLAFAAVTDELLDMLGGS